jgi:hypothetical protein
MGKPATQAGRVVGRLADIEQWFQQGHRHSEVVKMLEREGIKMNKHVLRRILKRYGLTQRQVLRRMARPVATDQPLCSTGRSTAGRRTAPAQSEAVVSISSPAGGGFQFRPDPNPKKKEILYGGKDPRANQ